MNYRALFAILLASAAAPMSSLAQGAGPYTPEQVYFVLLDSIRQAMGISEVSPTATTWLSLTTVGSLAEANDPAHINDLANFCPPAKPVLDSFGTQPKLDAVYAQLINSAVTPVRTFSSAYHEARSYLYTATGDPTPQVVAYNNKRKAYLTAWNTYHFATDLGQRNLALADMLAAEQDWKGGGFKYEVEDAQNTVAQEEYVAGSGRQANRRSVLSAYQNAGMTATDVAGAYRSPASSFSPDPTSWATSPGWVAVSFASDVSMSRYSSSSSSRSGFGGLSLGFISIGGSAGGNRTTESKLKAVYKLNYDFEIMRVSINRPWLDTSLFFMPLDWTWKKTASTTDFPYVSVARDRDSGRPLPSPTHIYDNKDIGCPLLPTEAVIARKRKIVATVSKSDYKYVQESGKASGGGALFGIFGGSGSQNWSSTVISDDGNNVTFSVTADGISVIGFVSQMIPVVPNPNLGDKWANDAWLPK